MAKSKTPPAPAPKAKAPAKAAPKAKAGGKAKKAGSKTTGK